ncbi:8764_t:CDS:2 [Dentiscutata erythropus]|uniref:8764_t:CDS:1 n=1 Tax=Dentiscutata erythropus TaxID=1348616 RepID=A0A9N9NRF9_9GLOM|nr:8764_t:CDS:2 [Dentiscutata erythropus]
MSRQFTAHVTSSRKYPTPNFSTFTPPINLPFPPTIKASDIVDRRNSTQLTMKSPNAFFIYRKAFLDHLSRTYQDLKMTDVSKLVGICWRNEPEIVKDEYRKLSREVEIELNNKRQKNVSFRRLTTPDYSSQQYIFYEFIPNPSDSTSDSTSGPTPDETPIASPTTEDTSLFITNSIIDAAYEAINHDVGHQHNRIYEDSGVSPVAEFVDPGTDIYDTLDVTSFYEFCNVIPQNDFYEFTE